MGKKKGGHSQYDKEMCLLHGERGKKGGCGAHGNGMIWVSIGFDIV